jgi:hypothetical protein
MIIISTTSTNFSGPVGTAPGTVSNENVEWFKDLIDQRKGQGIGFTENDKMELRVRSRSTKVDWWFELVEDDDCLRSGLVDALVMDVSNHDIRKIHDLLRLTRPADFSDTARAQLRNYISEILALEPVDFYQRQKNIWPLLLAGYIGIPEAKTLAELWLPPIEKTQRINYVDWVAIVVCARFGDQARVDQAINIVENYMQLKSFSINPFSTYFHLLKSEKAYRFLVDVVEREKPYFISDDAVVDFGGMARESLSKMVDRSEDAIKTSEGSDSMLDWLKTQPTIKFR